MPLQGATHVVLPANAEGAATLAVDVFATMDECRITVGGNSGHRLSGNPLVFATGPECAAQESPRTSVPGDVEGLRRSGAGVHTP